MRGRARRVVAELRRQTFRPATLRLVLGAVTFMGLMAWLGQSEEGLELPLSFTYHLLPLFMAPYAAHRVLADRDDGPASVLATAWLTRRASREQRRWIAYGLGVGAVLAVASFGRFGFAMLAAQSLTLATLLGLVTTWLRGRHRSTLVEDLEPEGA